MNSYMVSSNELIVKGRITSLKDLQRFGSFPKSFDFHGDNSTFSINSLDKTKFLVHSPTDTNYEPKMCLLLSNVLSHFLLFFFSFIT